MAVCLDCSVTLPVQTGRGAPRLRCPQCSAKRRGHKPPVIVVQKAPARPPVPPVPPVAPDGTLAAGVLAELRAMGRAGTVDGLAAVDAARALDLGGAELTGSARAALLKEMRTAFTAATAGQAPPAGVLDELRKRREAKP